MSLADTLVAIAPTSTYSVDSQRNILELSELRYSVPLAPAAGKLAVVANEAIDENVVTAPALLRKKMRPSLWFTPIWPFSSELGVLPAVFEYGLRMMFATPRRFLSQA